MDNHAQIPCPYSSKRAAHSIRRTPINIRKGYKVTGIAPNSVRYAGIRVLYPDRLGFHGGALVLFDHSFSRFVSDQGARGDQWAIEP